MEHQSLQKNLAISAMNSIKRAQLNLIFTRNTSEKTVNGHRITDSSTPYIPNSNFSPYIYSIPGRPLAMS